MFGIALLVGMSVLVASSMGIFQKPTTTHRANGNSTDDDSSSHNEKGHDDDHFDTGDGRPFSLLDPVSDLGLPEVTRFEGASPDWSYLGRAFPFNMKHGSKHDDEDNGIADNRRRAIPTNSWYQNLLLAHGQPSNLQRAYPSPYLVDVVGMIPGLRIHATHVNSNSMVMQLSFNEDYGLVVGAAADKSSHQSEKTKESTKKEEDHGGNTGKGLSQKYKVAETTDVGITLEWVRWMTMIIMGVLLFFDLIFLLFYSHKMLIQSCFFLLSLTTSLLLQTHTLTIINYLRMP
jgi:hypothetical protein